MFFETIIICKPINVSLFMLVILWTYFFTLNRRCKTESEQTIFNIENIFNLCNKLIDL